MGLVRNADGLLRKSAGFIKTCCCKKWLCDPFTQICTEDPSGPYTSEKQCNENCQRYDCDPNTGQCVATPTGPYANLAECLVVCEKKYKCDTNNYNCTEDPLGPYATLKECEDNCKEPKHYCCGSPGNPDDRDCYDEPCEDVGLDEFGVYDTPEECEDKCKAPHYACDPTTYTCYETPTGGYTDINLCNAECKPRYTCRTSDYTCIPDPNGPYESVAECEQYCKDTTYYCCGSPGNPDDRDCYTQPCSELGLDAFGEHETQEKCDEACKIDYYCCEDSEGKRFCSEDCEFDGANTIGGPYPSAEECDKACSPPKTYACREKSDGSKECVEDVFGTYDDDTCGGECDPPKKYSCRDNGDGTSTCVEDENGTYDDNECGGDCDKAAYTCVYSDEGIGDCVEAVGGEYGDDTCGGECDPPKKYSCQNGSCVEDPSGGYGEATCGGECEKPKKYSCQNGDCVEDPNGAYDEDTCGGSCDPNTFGVCCTDYGPKGATRQECDDLGGTFYLDAQAAEADCSCDCQVGGEYADDSIADLVPCDASADGGLNFFPGQSPSDIRYYGGFLNLGGYTSPAMQAFIDRGAVAFAGWFDAVQAVVREYSNLCCPGSSSYSGFRIKTFVLNCRKKEWEEVEVQSYDKVSSPQQPADCLGTGTPAPIPPVPEREVKDGKPTCVPRALNPLP